VTSCVSIYETTMPAIRFDRMTCGLQIHRTDGASFLA
jgi:hypothetical protein